jgi:ATP-dependent DNA helicase RecQ
MMSFQSVRSLLSPVRKSAFRLPSRHRSTTCSEIALSTLRKRFGLEEFLPGQQEIVEAVARGENSLVVLPTSGGKSMCYQLPALLRGGITLVVSPLIALMKDQVDALQAKGVRAAFINSQLSLVETKNCLDSLSKGEFELIYVAPERFLNPEFLTALEKVDIRLLAIDEAHCVSQWGHDFRPAYQRIGYVRTLLKYPATVALTATATSIVQQDILESLQMKNARVFRASIDRPNLLITVIQCKDTGESGYKAKIFSDREKLARLPKLVGKGPTIVYCATRKNVELVAKRLAERGQSVVSYHGGMSPEERNQVQEDFMGRGAEIVVATNAFGMGIDRPDIRTIVHYDLPGSVEAYYQVDDLNLYMTSCCRTLHAAESACLFDHTHRKSAVLEETDFPQMWCSCIHATTMTFKNSSSRVRIRA